MKVRGIKRGQNIEVSEQLNNIPDGTEIIIDVKFIADTIAEPQLLLTDSEKTS
ncbi:hypothetical protein ANSO36C_41180 [Nostoc cf. commune SO-36]|uniref:Uncharacterized protein n=1 Tax=Nostoc cf. commune SO-36 TaxID=449208 RepID=A0ABN6Q561_NOSCO|nr:hypothetical protein ANSO36C_41180 [Nostoc cf. commune SO-36]